jgi:DNA-binding CsgD family transcriptional regulator
VSLALSASTLEADIASRIADEYIGVLALQHGALVATRAREDQRHKHVIQMMKEVIRALDGRHEVSPTPGIPVDATIGTAFNAAGVGQHDMVNIVRALFDIAYAELTRHERWPAAAVASELIRRIMLDITSAFAAVRHHKTGTIESLDLARATAILTERETQVLEGVVANQTNKEIAAQLGIGEHAVKNHVTRIGHKLNAQGRTRVLQRARDLGLLVAVPAVVSGAITALQAVI